ncbi:MAG: polyphosphate polymerase domain-containing protein [Bacteroidales bacterium]|nr:polyphosphate polymerase domain-containing protein [Lachnoclostridium sp.]MCM1383868.1 polyphosphate polymerase domain-containing protein [Lachnoclostridium sp.]MCM1464479.1 polyphosphate polymerase domain-containing protein [Bacteroidales bacterium]
MSGKSYRHEIKELLSPVQTCLLEQRIRAVLQPDANGSGGRYQIRSIYFDTLSDKAYTEKEDGISRREKIRIRFYDCQPGLIKLERKEKRRDLIAKDSLIISKETADAMINGDYKSLTSYGSPLANSVYSLACAEGLHPVVVVDYVRNAYTYPVGNVRITFDSLLYAGRPDLPVWQPGGGMNVLGDNTILEIKFNDYLAEHIRRLLCSVPGERIALSKYTLCRRNLLWKQGDFLSGKD